MAEPFQFFLLGLGVGGIYALIAQGVVLIYRGSGVLNFAHGAIGALGAYAYFELMESGTPQVIAVLLGVGVSAFAGALTYLLVMRWLQKRSPVTRLVATLGIMTVIQQSLILRYPSAVFVDSILPAEVWRPFEGVVFSSDRIWILVVAAGLSFGLWALYRFTRFGWATVAAAENERATASMGWSPDVIALANWTLGSALAGLAVILILPIIGLSVLTLTLLIIPALATALVGGFRSFPLTLIGGLAVGVAESELTRYVDEPGWSRSVPFMVIVVVLVIRGDAVPARGEQLFRLPRVGSGLMPWWAPVGLLAVGWYWISSTDATGSLVLATTFAFALIMLSLVVVTGYAGQLSLAQFAFAGMGAFVAGRLADVAGLPFLAAVVVGVAAAIPLGAIIALPALRTRGISLAIATFGLALAIEKIVLNNNDWTGGYVGTVVGRPTLFGWEVDSLFHPKRYALVCLVALAIAMIMVANVRRGSTGRRLLAVRANERAAVALGVSAVRAKLYGFALAASIAALGGILLGFRSSQISFAPFTVQASINAVVFTVVGGIGYIASGLFAGAAQPGAIVSHLLSEFDWEKYFLLMGGGVLIFNLLRFPDGALSYAPNFMRRLMAILRRDREEELAEGARQRVAPRSLRVRGASVRFGGVQALKDVDIHVEPGKVTGLIGPNGAGKTTLIDVITGFTKPEHGTIDIDGKRINSLSPRRRSLAGIGRSFQGLELFEDMSVMDNIRVASDSKEARTYFTDLVKPRRVPLPATAVAAIDEFELHDDLHKLPSELPHGRRRLVGIARAVAAQPSVLLLDEPAAGLDDVQRRELRTLIRRLADDWGIAVLLIEHDVPTVLAVCDDVVALDFGSVIATGTGDEVASHPAVVRAYLGEEPEVEPELDEGAPP